MPSLATPLRHTKTVAAHYLFSACPTKPTALSKRITVSWVDYFLPAGVHLGTEKTPPGRFFSLVRCPASASGKPAGQTHSVCRRAQLPALRGQCLSALRAASRREPPAPCGAGARAFSRVWANTGNQVGDWQPCNCLCLARLRSPHPFFGAKKSNKAFTGRAPKPTQKPQPSWRALRCNGCYVRTGSGLGIIALLL